MQKYFKLSKSVNIVPEAMSATSFAISLLIVLLTRDLTSLFDFCLLLSIYSVILRIVWNSAIAVHGLGHTIAIALADRNLSVFNLTNILEHQSIADILKSLLPFQPIFIPIFSPHLPISPLSEGVSFRTPYLATGNPHYIRAKAIGGILFNFIVAIAFFAYGDGLLAQAVVVANLLIAFSSISDLEASITGVADYLYCGNFGLIAQRQPSDGEKLLPDRMLDIALQMGQETEVRGEQAGGGLVVGKNNDSTVFVGKKIVNRKRGNLTKSLETAFAPIRNRAISAGVKPLSTVMGVWHYRYATSGTVPSELETHWHEWMGAREEKVWRFTGREWLCESRNVHHRITHNGDFDCWQIFNQEIKNTTLGLWLKRVLHTPNAAKGDSPKIAGMMDLLVTQGMWCASVRLAYQQAIAISIEDTFDGRKPSVVAPNTAPSQGDLKAWAGIFESAFTSELSHLKLCDADKITPTALKSSNTLRQALITALGNHSSAESLSKLQIISLIQFAIEAFFNNDLYRATQIFIDRAKGSFGLVTASTLSESELVLCAKGQPMTVGFNWSQGYMVYASEPAAVDRVLLNKPQSFRLDLDRENGEVAKVSAKNMTIYSLTQQQELGVLHLKNRWISMTEHPHLAYVKPTATERDPVAYDINEIPQVLHEIKTDWLNPISLNRRSADYLIYLLTEKVQRFEKRQRLMFKAGLLSKIRTMPTVDLLITGEENSLWAGEKFAGDIKIVFPFLNVVTISANQILQQLDRGFGQLNLGKDSLILAITQSGQTFSTVQVINVFDHLSSQGTIGELFILTGELSSFINSTQGKGGLTTISHSSFVDRDNHRYRIFINGSDRRTAEPSTIAVAAALQTLTELLFYLAKQMRSDFPHSDPLGMTLTTESLMVLAMMKEDFLSKNVPNVIGTGVRGKPFKSNTKQILLQHGRYWANHVTETPLAWAIQALYILVSVGWAIPFGHALPLVKTLSGLLFNFLGVSPEFIALFSPAIAIADIGVYIFGVWLWTVIIRCCQGRQILARTGKRTLVIGDITWVNQLLQAYVSKLFSLSYGIATIEVHSANPQDSLLHSFGHRVVRGTLIWLGIPDGRRSQEQQAAENAVIMTGKQANGVRNFNIGAEIVAIGNNPQIGQQGFSQSLILDSNNDAIYFRNAAVTEQKEQIEALRESCFGSFERLLSSYIFFWAMAKKVASFPFLKYEYWKSQSRTKVMTTASPVGGFDTSKLNEQLQRKANLPERAKNNQN